MFYARSRFNLALLFVREYRARVRVCVRVCVCARATRMQIVRFFSSPRRGGKKKKRTLTRGVTGRRRRMWVIIIIVIVVVVVVVEKSESETTTTTANGRLARRGTCSTSALKHYTSRRARRARYRTRKTKNESR